MDKITLILVSYGKNPCEFINMNLISVLSKKSTSLNQIIVVHNKEKNNYEKKEIKKNTEILHIGRKEEDGFIVRGYATHEALKYANGDYIIISDPDIIYSMNEFDQYYLNLYKKYSLNIIGAQHHHEAPYDKFPCVINMFVKHNTLPKKDWMQNEPWESSPWLDKAGRHRFNPSMFLVQTKLTNKINQFPNPQLPRHLWDVGVNLWLWNQEIQGKYLTFLHQGKEKELYYTDKIFANFEVEKQKKHQLYIHARYSTTKNEKITWIY